MTDSTPASGTSPDSDWSGLRGQQWLANVTKMEGMLSPVDEPLFAGLRLSAGLQVAEIGCGGGGTAISMAVRDSVATVLDITPADPEAPGPFRYAKAEKLTSLLRDAGFSELSVDPWQGSLALGGGLPPVDAASFSLAAFTS
ncbi:MAG: hypothetical protein AB8B57_11055 [Congregibacter sp.]